MKHSLALWLFLFLTYSFSCHSQSKAVLKGTVYNEQAEPVENARVDILNSSYRTASNQSGTFLLELPPGSYNISINKNGYASEKRVVSLGPDTKVDLQIILQPDIEKLQEVIISSQKREEFLQQVPVSITSLSSKEIQNFRLQHTSELSAIAPNLYTSDPGDGRTVTSLRGVVSTSYDPAVATYVDGVNQFNLDTYIPELFDVERIEILRGPQGTLYGRNAMGGVVNIITRKPTGETSYFGKASLANFGQKRLMGGLRSGFFDDRVLFGAALLYDRSDGYYFNEFTNSNYDSRNSLSGNYYLKFPLSPKWNINFNVKHRANRNNGAFPLVMGIEEAFENPYRLNQNQVSKMIDNSLNTSLVISHIRSNFSISSQSSYQRNYRYYEEAIDADFSALDAVSIFNNYGKDWNKVEVLTQEFLFTSAQPENAEFQWTAGTFLFYQESPVKQAIVFGEDAGVLGAEDTNFSLISSTETKGTGAAVFGQLSYTPTKKITITGGLRYDHETKEQSILGEYQKEGSPEAGFEFQKDTTASASFNALSPKLSITYSFSEVKLLFLSYSRGFRAGGLTPLSSDPTQPPLYEYEPEFSNNYEAGSKNSFFENRLQTNVSLFYTKITNIQTPRLVLPDAVTVIRNTGRLTSKGAEIELKTLLSPGFDLSWNYGFTDASFESLIISTEEGEVNLKNNWQVFTPKFTSLLAGQYTQRINKDKKTDIFARVEWKYLGRQYFDLANTLEQEAYSLFNTQIGLSHGSWTLRLWGRNVFDKRFLSYGYDFGAVSLGMPASVGVDISFGI